jgi:hypothetical protein
MDDQHNLESLDDAPGSVEEGEVQEVQGQEGFEKVESPLKRNWPIIVVGVAMLVVGVVLGYFGRGAYGPEAMAAKATSSAVAVAIQTRASANKEVMTMLIGATRHFKGDANAPVTIIEFSDFQ